MRALTKAGLKSPAAIAVGVAVTILPATDLFLMGRDQTYNVRRGLVDANLFVENGCNCTISTIGSRGRISLAWRLASVVGPVRYRIARTCLKCLACV